MDCSKYFCIPFNFLLVNEDAADKRIKSPTCLAKKSFSNTLSLKTSKIPRNIAMSGAIFVLYPQCLLASSKIQMVQVIPVPFPLVRKFQYHLLENCNQKFQLNGKRSGLFHANKTTECIQVCINHKSVNSGMYGRNVCILPPSICFYCYVSFPLFSFAKRIHSLFSN